MTLSNVEKKHLRRIGHKLNPVVTVASKGLTDTVIAEIERALTDHELIKVRLMVDERSEKHDILTQICERLGAEAVQTVGHIALIYRKTDKPDPRLSNLLR